MEDSGLPRGRGASRVPPHAESSGERETGRTTQRPTQYDTRLSVVASPVSGTGRAAAGIINRFTYTMMYFLPIYFWRSGFLASRGTATQVKPLGVWKVSVLAITNQPNQYYILQ